MIEPNVFWNTNSAGFDNYHVTWCHTPICEETNRGEEDKTKAKAGSRGKGAEGKTWTPTLSKRSRKEMWLFHSVLPPPGTKDLKVQGVSVNYFLANWPSFASRARRRGDHKGRVILKINSLQIRFRLLRKGKKIHTQWPEMVKRKSCSIKGLYRLWNCNPPHQKKDTFRGTRTNPM